MPKQVWACNKCNTVWDTEKLAKRCEKKHSLVQLFRHEAQGNLYVDFESCSDESIMEIIDIVDSIWGVKKRYKHLES